MMRLSSMLRFIQAFDGAQGAAWIEPFLAHWEHDDRPVHLLRASSNFIFAFQNAGLSRILRLSPDSERSLELVQAEINFLNHICALGYAAAWPVAARDGRFVVEAESEQGACLAAVFAGLAGEWYETETLPPEYFPAWGKALGELHNASQGYASSGRPTWRDLLGRVASRLPSRESRASFALERVRRKLEELPADAGTFGLVHFDFELDNLAWVEGKPTAIDFDDCALHWYAADIAFALRDLFGDRADRVDLSQPHLQAFLAGYRSVRPLSEVEVARLPLFLIFNHLVHFGDILRSIEEPALPGQPPWALNLRQRLERKLEIYREVFSRCEQLL